MTGWSLRPAVNGDVRALAAIESQAFGAASWGGRGVADGLTDRLVETIVANDAGGMACGFLMWRRVSDEAEIMTLAVAPDAQRRGCARALVRALFDAARGAGVRSLFLEVDAGNAPAIGLYRSAGFSRIARRPRYYKSGADALVMRADL